MTTYYLTRLNTDGSVDPTFTPPSLNDWVFDVLQDPNGDYLVGGDFTASGNVPASLVRLQSSGSVDPTFAPPVLNDWVAGVNLNSDGTYMIAGAFQQAGSPSGPTFVARLVGGTAAPGAKALKSVPGGKAKKYPKPN